MRRLALVGVLAVGLSFAATSVASGNSITPMCTTDQGGTQACGSGWYTAPVVLSWQWSPIDGSTPSPACAASQEYSVDTNTTVTCSVSWPSPPDLIWPQPIRVEVSSPAATALPSRPPDSDGWYNHPVAGVIDATAFSGIASCAATTYAGPSTTAATVSGTCTDNAGKTVTVTSAPFYYDATAPALAVGATAGDQSVSLGWETGGDVAPIASITVARGGTAVYRGTAAGFDDTDLTNGVRYTYTITARDAAGNTTTKTVRVTPAARVLSPAQNAHVAAPPTLSWTAAPGATYYNVQLYRGDPTKLLSLWPVQANLRLKRTWRFDGRNYRLKPGRYKWYVWPGFGKRKAARYGHMIGSGTFVVVR